LSLNKEKKLYVRKELSIFRLTAASDKVYQLLAHGRWFSPGTPASSTTKIGCHDIAVESGVKHQKSTKPGMNPRRIGDRLV
jgi:hypothetical protein